MKIFSYNIYVNEILVFLNTYSFTFNPFPAASAAYFYLIDFY